MMDLATLALQEYVADVTPATARDRRMARAIAQTTMRRCRTRQQGIALMTIGHAIEYLVQSRLIGQPTTTGAEREAMAILVDANLSLYSEGTEVVSLVGRLRQWFHGSGMKPRTANAQ